MLHLRTRCILSEMYDLPDELEQNLDNLFLSVDGCTDILIFSEMLIVIIIMDKVTNWKNWNPQVDRLF